MTSRKSWKPIRTFLCLSLLSATTPAFADIDPPDINYGPGDIELGYGRQAPFDGVLTTKLRYIEYTSAVDQNEYLNKRLMECLSNPEYANRSWTSDAAWLLGGIVLGFVANSMVQK